MGDQALTEARQRRDLYMWINEHLCFFGEAKITHAGLQEAEAELISKSRACMSFSPSYYIPLHLEELEGWAAFVYCTTKKIIN